MYILGSTKQRITLTSHCPQTTKSVNGCVMKICPVTDIPLTLLMTAVFLVVVTPTSMSLTAQHVFLRWVMLNDFYHVTVYHYDTKCHYITVCDNNIFYHYTPLLCPSDAIYHRYFVLITKTTNDTTDLAINNTFCVCFCKYANETLNESLERRRKELVLKNLTIACHKETHFCLGLQKISRSNKNHGFRSFGSVWIVFVLYRCMFYLVICFVLNMCKYVSSIT